jgi:cell division septum initiation protein DivIVA
MVTIMDPEDELNFLIKENKELKKLVSDLKEKISQKDTQLDTHRLKIDELQQLLFRLRDAV